MAVKDGSVDINAFQHYNFLDNWNSKNDKALVAVADTYIAPIRLYSGTENGKTNTLLSKKFLKVEQSLYQMTQQMKAVPCMSCNQQV